MRSRSSWLLASVLVGVAGCGARSTADAGTDTGSDCWDDYPDLREPPSLCERPCVADPSVCLPDEDCFERVEGCDSPVCATGEEACFAYGCPAPCCVAAGDPPFFPVEVVGCEPPEDCCG